MKLLRQIRAVTAMNFRSLPQRASTSLVIVIGIAGVVAVLVSVLAMSTGLIRTMENAGRDDRAIVLRNGSIAETSSALDRNSARAVQDAAGIKRNAQGVVDYFGGRKSKLRKAAHGLFEVLQVGGTIPLFGVRRETNHVKMGGA